MAQGHLSLRFCSLAHISNLCPTRSLRLLFSLLSVRHALVYLDVILFIKVAHRRVV